MERIVDCSFWQRTIDYSILRTKADQYANAFAAAGLNIVSGTPSPLIAPQGWLEMKKNAVVELRPGEIWTPYYEPTR